MSQDQLDRLQRLRAARGQSDTRLEPVRGGQQGPWSPSLAAQQGRTGGGHGGRLVGLLLIIVLAGAVIGGGAYVLKQIHSSAGGPRRIVAFQVTRGEGISTIADQLARDGLVSSSVIFRLYYQFGGGSGTILSGSHALNSGMSMDEIAKALQTPPVVAVAHVQPAQNQYNFLPGKRAEEIATILDKYHIASYDSVMHEIKYGKYNYWFLKSLPPGASIEGFLAPGEYTLPPHSSAHSVVALMLRKFGQNFTPAMVAQAAREHMTIYQIVTLASIVQRENFLPKVQKAIAGVFYNRLKPESAAVTAQKLNSDTTVQYIMGYDQASHTWWRKDVDTTIDSPYNTYLHGGLPPGPISNPGPSALNAALNPTPSNWLFFQVLTKNGRSHTYFCTTFACHSSQGGVTIQ
jgi:UPF0755 protein